MDTESTLRFLDFPMEIRQLILWKCLEGWRATVEIHRKEHKTTARIFSSVIYDALMLSLTCKSFHYTIQRIQYDPRLFNGEVDLIEANAQLAYLVGRFTSHAPLRRGSKPSPLYRTQLFIKNKPYRGNKNCRQKQRLQYHAKIRHWVMQNVTSMGLWADEVTPRVPWDMFPQLEHVTMYWPHINIAVKDTNLYLCQHAKDDFVEMVQKSYNTKQEWFVRTIRPVVDLLTARGLTVTLDLETTHAHETGALVQPIYVLQSDGTFRPRTFYTLECQVQIQGEEWRVDRVVCDDQTPITFDVPAPICIYSTPQTAAATQTLQPSSILQASTS